MPEMVFFFINLLGTKSLIYDADLNGLIVSLFVWKKNGVKVSWLAYRPRTFFGQFL